MMKHRWRGGEEACGLERTFGFKRIRYRDSRHRDRPLWCIKALGRDGNALD
jgi:hypothetical protein